MAEQRETDSTIKVGDRIVYFGSTHPRRGKVKWLGPLEDISNDLVAGIQLDKPCGTNDGSWCKKQLFECKPKHGIFVDVKALLKEEDFTAFEENDESESSDVDVGSIDNDGDAAFARAVPNIFKEEERKKGRIANDMAMKVNSSVDDDIRELMVNLELALCEGEELFAADTAKKLARKRVKCVIRPKTDGAFASYKPNLEVVPKVEIPTLTLHVKVERGDAEYPMVIKVPIDYTIEQLKNKVQQQEHISADLQAWFFNEEMLSDDMAIIDSDDRTPILFIRKNPPKNKGKNAAADKKKPIELKWECEKCTFCNEPTTLTCMMCTARWPENFNGPAALKSSYRKLIAKEKELRAKHEKELEKKFKEYQKLDDTQIIMNPEEFECIICMGNVEKGMGIILQNCLHSFCANCLTETIKNSEEIPVKCPYAGEYYCDRMMQEREINQLLSEEEFQKYTNRLTAKAAAEMKNSFYCKTPDCKGWCVYEYGAQAFNCEICKKASCITCQAIHEGENCRQYQDRLKLEAQNNEDARKTQEAINEMLRVGTAMICPGCGITVMKINGCDGMTCSQCRIEICWATKGPRWGPKGRGDTSGGCKCNFAGKRCHPNCLNCH